MILVLTSQRSDSTYSGVVAALKGTGMTAVFVPYHPTRRPDFGIPEAILAVVNGVIFDGMEIERSNLSKVLPDGMGVHPYAQVADWCRAHPGVHSVLLHREWSGVQTVRVDSEDAIFRMGLHLREVHGVTNPLFIAGPEGNQSAQLRKQSFLSAARQFNWPTENRILTADFNALSAQRAFEKALGEGLDLDSVICSTDLQALGVSRVIGAKGLKPIPITGFDNQSEFLNKYRNLTTVHFDDRTIAFEAAKILVRQVEQGDSPDRTSVHRVRVPLVLRESCGCSGGTEPLRFREETVHRFFKGPEREKWNTLTGLLASDPTRGVKAWAEWADREAVSHWNLIRFSRMLYEEERNCLSPLFITLDKALLDAANLHNLNQLSGTRQKHLTINQFILELGLLPENESMANLVTHFFQRLEVPAECMRYHERSSPSVETMENGKAPEDFPLPSAEDGTLAVVPIIWSEKIFGTLSFTRVSKAFALSGLLRQVLGNRLATQHAFAREMTAKRRLQDAVDLLEQHNLHLKETSESDPLTGLLNRLGFMNRGQPLWQRAEEKKRPCLLLFADLDGLKSINDQYGHDAGDRAIQGAAQCLSRSLRKTDICCRLGGDEFTALLIGIGDRALPIVRKRLESHVQQWNLDNPVPWKLAISLGGCERPTQERLTFEAHMALADQRLYEQKRERKSKRGDFSP